MSIAFTTQQYILIVTGLFIICLTYLFPLIVFTLLDPWLFILRPSQLSVYSWNAADNRLLIINISPDSMVKSLAYLIGIFSFTLSSKFSWSKSSLTVASIRKSSSSLLMMLVFPAIPLVVLLLLLLVVLFSFLTFVMHVIVARIITVVVHQVFGEASPRMFSGIIIFKGFGFVRPAALGSITLFLWKRKS